MNIEDLTGKEPAYIFPDMQEYLTKDLLPGMDELLGYAEALPLAPNDLHGLTSRIGAMHFDLMSGLAGVHAGRTKPA